MDKQTDIKGLKYDVKGNEDSRQTELGRERKTGKERERERE